MLFVASCAAGRGPFEPSGGLRVSAVRLTACLCSIATTTVVCAERGWARPTRQDKTEEGKSRHQSEPETPGRQGARERYSTVTGVLLLVLLVLLAD